MINNRKYAHMGSKNMLVSYTFYLMFFFSEHSTFCSFCFGEYILILASDFLMLLTKMSSAKKEFDKLCKFAAIITVGKV